MAKNIYDFGNCEKNLTLLRDEVKKYYSFSAWAWVAKKRRFKGKPVSPPKAGIPWIPTTTDKTGKSVIDEDHGGQVKTKKSYLAKTEYRATQMSNPLNQHGWTKFGVFAFAPLTCSSHPRT